MAEQQDLAGIIKGIQNDVRTIVQGEIELVKAELLPQARSAGVGAGLIGAAAYLAVTAGLLFFFGMSFLLGYGFMNWFLNTDKKLYPNAPASAFVHVGNGTNIIYVDPENELVVVARWIENNKINEFIGKLAASVTK